VLRIDVPENAGACQIVWNDGYELQQQHVSVPVEPSDTPPGTARAAVDLGEIHQAAVTTDTGAALVVSGRGIRSITCRLNQTLGEIARKRARCAKGSRRWRKPQRARARVSARVEHQVRDLRRKGTRKVVEFLHTARCEQSSLAGLTVCAAARPVGTTTSGCLSGSMAGTSTI
jgi:putative transposase